MTIFEWQTSIYSDYYYNSPEGYTINTTSGTTYIIGIGGDIDAAGEYTLIVE